MYIVIIYIMKSARLRGKKYKKTKRRVHNHKKHQKTWRQIQKKKSYSRIRKTTRKNIGGAALTEQREPSDAIRQLEEQIKNLEQLIKELEDKKKVQSG